MFLLVINNLVYLPFLYPTQLGACQLGGWKEKFYFQFYAENENDGNIRPRRV